MKKIIFALRFRRFRAHRVKRGGSIKHPAAYIYIHTYIYICAVGSITWPYFGQSRVDNLAMVGSITWPSFFEPIKIGVLGDFLVHSFQGVVQK